MRRPPTRIEFVTIRYAGRMADQRFSGLSDEDLADIWYALAGAEIRHTDCFKHLVDATIYELELRKGAGCGRSLICVSAT